MNLMKRGRASPAFGRRTSCVAARLQHLLFLRCGAEEVLRSCFWENKPGTKARGEERAQGASVPYPSGAGAVPVSHTGPSPWDSAPSSDKDLSRFLSVFNQLLPSRTLSTVSFVLQSVRGRSSTFSLSFPSPEILFAWDWTCFLDGFWHLRPHFDAKS